MAAALVPRMANVGKPFELRVAGFNVAAALVPRMDHDGFVGIARVRLASMWPRLSCRGWITGSALAFAVRKLLQCGRGSRAADGCCAASMGIVHDELQCGRGSRAADGSGSLRAASWIA